MSGEDGPANGLFTLRNTKKWRKHKQTNHKRKNKILIWSPKRVIQKWPNMKLVTHVLGVNFFTIVENSNLGGFFL